MNEGVRLRAPAGAAETPVYDGKITVDGTPEMYFVLLKCVFVRWRVVKLFYSVAQHVVNL